MTRDEILRVVPPAAKLLGREIIDIDSVHGGVKLRFTAQPEFRDSAEGTGPSTDALLLVGWPRDGSETEMQLREYSGWLASSLLL
jgi:hypothetical protein